MKKSPLYGSPIHVGGGFLVHLCHPVAHMTDNPGVLWHTREDGFVFLSNDICGRQVARVIPDVGEFMNGRPFKYLGLPENVGPLLLQALMMAADHK